MTKSNIRIITSVSEGAIGLDFCMSKMFGRLDLRQMCGETVKSADNKVYEPVKQMVFSANTVISQDVIDQLIRAPKYVVTELDVVSTGATSKHNIAASEGSVIGGSAIVDTYMAEKIDQDRIAESYAKGNADMHNKGVFYLLSEINGTPQLFAANVLASGHTGKSVSLMYLPNGYLENAVMLERVCYHGKQGNEHMGLTGDQIGRTDVHMHIMDEVYMDSVVNCKLPYSRKVVDINSPTPHCITKGALPDDANIGRMVDYAMDSMHIEGILPKLSLDTQSNISAAVNNAIDSMIALK